MSAYSAVGLINSLQSSAEKHWHYERSPKEFGYRMLACGIIEQCISDFRALLRRGRIKRGNNGQWAYIPEELSGFRVSLFHRQGTATIRTWRGEKRPRNSSFGSVSLSYPEAVELLEFMKPGGHFDYLLEELALDDFIPAIREELWNPPKERKKFYRAILNDHRGRPPAL